MREFIQIINESLALEEKDAVKADAAPEEFAADDDGADVLPISDDDLDSASMPPKVRQRLFKNREAPEGTLVAVRLNLNTRIKKGDKDYSMQTVHSRGHPNGSPIGYDKAVTLRNCTFYVNQNERARIALKQAQKSPMAAVVGLLTHDKPNLKGVEVRFNPFDTHLFVRADNGRAVKTADEVTIFNKVCYARGEITYWDREAAPKPKQNVPTGAKFGDED